MGEPLQTPKDARIAKRNAQTAERWRGWIEGPVRDNVLRLHQQRVVWDGMQEVIARNSDIPRHSVLWEYLFDTYTISQAAAIRRLAETQEQSASLAQLLEQMGASNETVTRAWWLSGWATNWNQLDEGNRRFDALAGVGTTQFPAQQAADDLDELRQRAAKVKRFVDRYIAHIDRRGLDLEDAPKLRELHHAIDLIRKLYIRYHELLTRWTDAQAELSLDISNWRDPLKLAWIMPPGAPDKT
jgi:hypothetical protein